MNQQDRRTNVGGRGKAAPVTDDKATPADELAEAIARVREQTQPNKWRNGVAAIRDTDGRLLLAAVSAERDRADRAEARAVVCEHQSDNYLTMMRERDAARQMIADAPHGAGCSFFRTNAGLSCDCWKAGL